MTTKTSSLLNKIFQITTCAALSLTGLVQVPVSAAGPFSAVTIKNNVTYQGPAGEQFATDFGIVRDNEKESLTVCLDGGLASYALDNNGDLVVFTNTTGQADMQVYARAYNSLSSEVMVPGDICNGSNALEQPLLYDATVDLDQKNVLELNGSLVYDGAATTYRLFNSQNISSTNALPIVNTEFLNLTEGFNNNFDLQTSKICINGEIIDEYESGNRSFYVPTGTNLMTMVSSQTGLCGDTGVTTVSEFQKVNLTSAEQLVNVVQIKPTIYVGENTQNNVEATLLSSSLPNRGDLNNDGVVDTTQSDKVKSIFVEGPAGVSNLVAAQVNCDGCTLSELTYDTESRLKLEDPESFVGNLVSFTIAGSEAEVELFFYTDQTNVTPMKVYPETGETAVIPDVQTENMTIDGESVVKVSYPLTDGGALDVDGIVNGTIVDPVGLMMNGEDMEEQTATPTGSLVRTGGVSMEKSVLAPAVLLFLAASCLQRLSRDR